MKTLSILFLILFSKTLIAQTKNSIYIYSSTVSGGQITILEYPNVKINLHKYSESIDNAKKHKGDYKTIFAFQEIGTVVNRIFTLRFDKPVKSCDLICPNGVSRVTSTSNKEKTAYKFVINQIKADKFSFVIYSKKQIYTKIDEISKYIQLK